MVFAQTDQKVGQSVGEAYHRSVHLRTWDSVEFAKSIKNNLSLEFLYFEQDRIVLASLDDAARARLDEWGQTILESIHLSNTFSACFASSMPYLRYSACLFQ